MRVSCAIQGSPGWFWGAELRGAEPRAIAWKGHRQGLQLCTAQTTGLRHSWAGAAEDTDRYTTMGMGLRSSSNTHLVCNVVLGRPLRGRPAASDASRAANRYHDGFTNSAESSALPRVKST